MRYADMLTRKDSRSVVHFNSYIHVPLILQNTTPPFPHKTKKKACRQKDSRCVTHLGQKSQERSTEEYYTRPRLWRRCLFCPFVQPGVFLCVFPHILLLHVRKEEQRNNILSLIFFRGVVFFALLYNLMCFYVCS